MTGMEGWCLENLVSDSKKLQPTLACVKKSNPLPPQVLEKMSIPNRAHILYIPIFNCFLIILIKNVYK